MDSRQTHNLHYYVLATLTDSYKSGSLGSQHHPASLSVSDVPWNTYELAESRKAFNMVLSQRNTIFAPLLFLPGFRTAWQFRVLLAGPRLH